PGGVRQVRGGVGGPRGGPWALRAQGQRRRRRRNRGVAPRVTTVAAGRIVNRGDPLETEVGVCPPPGSEASPMAPCHETITEDSTARSRTPCGGLRRTTARRTDRLS